MTLAVASSPIIGAAPLAQGPRGPLFEGVFLGGFECSCQKLADGRRLDLIAATQHDELADRDYARLRQVGMTACRDGASWVTAERGARYDFSRIARMLHAANRHGIDV